MEYLYGLGVQTAYMTSTHFPLAKIWLCGSSRAARESGKCSFPVCIEVFPLYHMLLCLSFGIFYKVQYGL